MCQSKVTKTVTFHVNELSAPWICKGGLYKLVLKSKAKHAEMFQDWVCEEVLPSIRKMGTYKAPSLGQQIKLRSDTKVMDCVWVQFPEFHVIPELGDMQPTTQQRSDGWKKGYVGGQPGLLMLSRTVQYHVFAIALKTTKGDGELSKNTKQADDLEQFENLRYNILVSNSYDVIVTELTT